MVARGKISSALNQPLLRCCVGGGMVGGLKDGSGVGKPVADTTGDKGLKGGCRDSLALGLGYRRPFQ
jgi:hypothetical protein